MKIEKNESKNRKARVKDMLGNDFGVMDPLEFAKFILRRQNGIMGLVLTCAGILPSGKECGCRVHFCFGSEKSPYFAVDKDDAHREKCPNANQYLVTIHKELSKEIKYDFDGFYEELMETTNKAGLPKVEFKETTEEPPNMDSIGNSDGSLTNGSQETFSSERMGFREKDGIIPIRLVNKEKNFDFGKTRNEEIAHFRRVYMTTVRNPRVPLELYIQIRTNADLNDNIVGSDTVRYKDVIFCHEAKKSFRVKSGLFAGKVIPVFARKERQSTVDAIKGDMNLQNTINQDNRPIAVMSDSYFVTKDESDRYHNEERVLFVLTFPDEETEKAFKEIFKDKKSYVNGKWVSRPNYNWKKNFFLFVRWDSEYDGFIDPDGFRRKVVKGQCISIEKQLKKVENDLFSELEGEFIK